MRRPPGVVVVAPRIGPGLDRGEAVAAVGVGQAAADAGEVRVERGRVLVALVDVAAGRVGLPDLDQLAGAPAAVAVEHPAGDDDPLADRLAAVLDGQVGLERVHVACPKTGANSSIVSGSAWQGPWRVAQDAAAVGRVVGSRWRFLATSALRASKPSITAAISASISAWLRCWGVGPGRQLVLAERFVVDPISRAPLMIMLGVECLEPDPNWGVRRTVAFFNLPAPLDHHSRRRLCRTSG